MVDTTTPGNAISCLTAAGSGPDSAGWFTSAPTCTVTGSDTVQGSGIQQVQYTVYGPGSGTAVYGRGSTRSVDNLALTISQTGTYTLQATVTNDAGTSATRTQTVKVDAATVAAPVTSAPPAGTCEDTSHPSIAGTGTPADTVTVYVDGSAMGRTTVSANGTWSVAPSVALSQGSHVVTATQTDPFGKVGPASPPRYLIVDIAPPSPPVAGARIAASTTSGDVRLSFSDATAGVSYRYSLDGGRWVTGGRSYSASGLRPGAHRLAVETVSRAGVASAQTVITWTVYPPHGPHGLPTRTRVLADARMTASTAKGVDVQVSVNAGSIQHATVMLYHGGRLIGRATRAERSRGRMRLYVRVRLNAYGSRLLDHSNASGVAVQVRSDVKPFSFKMLRGRAAAYLYVAYATVAVTVHFANASARLSAAAQRELNAHVGAPKRVRDILVVGNTDSYGGTAYNYALGLRRAQAVIRYLRRHGVDARPAAVSHGPSTPVAGNQTAAGRAMNRNATVAVTYYDVGWPAVAAAAQATMPPGATRLQPLM